MKQYVAERIKQAFEEEGDGLASAALPPLPPRSASFERPRGRPRLRPEGLTKTVNVRVSLEEHAALKRSARECRMSMSKAVLLGVDMLLRRVPESSRHSDGHPWFPEKAAPMPAPHTPAPTEISLPIGSRNGCTVFAVIRFSDAIDRPAVAALRRLLEAIERTLPGGETQEPKPANPPDGSFNGYPHRRHQDRDRRIFEDSGQGADLDTLAKRYSLSAQRIRQILQEENWRREHPTPGGAV